MCDSHHHHEAATTATPAGSDVTFQVSDMTCGHCAGVIRSALQESMPGAAVDIDTAKTLVTVAGDQAKADAALRTASSTQVPGTSVTFAPIGRASCRDKVGQIGWNLGS